MGILLVYAMSVVCGYLTYIIVHCGWAVWQQVNVTLKAE